MNIFEKIDPSLMYELPAKRNRSDNPNSIKSRMAAINPGDAFMINCKDRNHALSVRSGIGTNAKRAGWKDYATRIIGSKLYVHRKS